MNELFLRIHNFEPLSRANGPGLRAVIWVQGCTLGCPGCFNPQTHIRTAGENWPVSSLMDKILAEQGNIEGVTISGGEPLQQRPALQALLSRIKLKTSLSVVLFSGYTWFEIQKMRRINGLLSNLDVLLAGRYDQSQHIAASLTGSANKTIHFLTPRYTINDIQTVPVAEVILTETGEIHLTGINPVHW
jgi:anaerobic ribonucleoside-triphosphate reductase activating protein